MAADSVDSASSQQGTSSGSQSGTKVCRVCGKDLTGHRRVKDSLGYICVACVKAEAREEAKGTVPCPECGRRLKPSGLVPWRDKLICRSCLKDHEELNRFKTPPPSSHRHDEHQKKRLLVMLGIAAALGLIIILSRAGVIGSSAQDNRSPAEINAAKSADKGAAQ